MARVELQLYVAGEGLPSRVAIANWAKICDDDLEDECDVEVIDVDKHPPSLVSESFLATPMLVRRLPLPVHRVIGDLSDGDAVLAVLGLARRAEGGP